MRELLSEEVLEAHIASPVPVPVASPVPELDYESEAGCKEAKPTSDSDSESESDCDPRPDHGVEEPIVRLKPILAFRHDLENAVDWAYTNRLTNFTFGIYLALMFPRLGWTFLTLAWSYPTAIIFNHLEWFQSFETMEWLDLLTILAYCILSEAMAIYCVSKIIT